MIERIDSNNGMDWAALLGRGVLVAGSGYGLHKTYQEFKGFSTLKHTSFKERMAKNLAPSNPINSFNSAVNPNLFSENPLMISKPERMKYKRIKGGLDEFRELMTGKGFNSELTNEVTRLHNYLLRRGDVEDVGILTKGKNLEAIQLYAKRGGKTFWFPFSPVNKEKEITRGWNLQSKYSAVSLLETPEDVLNSRIITPDIFLGQEYNRQADLILEGKIQTKDLYNQAYKSSIYDEGAYGQSEKMEVSKIGRAKAEQRKFKVSLDPRDEFTGIAKINQVKAFHQREGGGIGTAADMARGQAYMKGSPLSRLPGAEVSANIPQQLRNTVIQRTIPFSQGQIDWMPGLQPSHGKFMMKALPEEDRELIKGIRQRISGGRQIAEEIAEESLIWNKNRQAKITTDLYSYKADINKPLTKFSERILHDIALSKGMTSSSLIEHLRTEGSIGVEYDLLANYKTLLKKKENQKLFLREAKLSGDLDKETVLKQELEALNQEIKDYGVFGYKPESVKALEEQAGDFGKLTRLKDKDIADNVLTSISLKENEIVFKTRSGNWIEEGTKFFAGSGFKQVVSGLEDVETILEQHAYHKAKGYKEITDATWGPEEELKAMGLKGKFKDVDFFAFREPFKFNKEGAIAQRDIPTAIQSYAERMAEMDYADIKAGLEPGNKDFLGQLGLRLNKNNIYEGTLEAPTDINALKRIREINPGMTDKEIFSSIFPRVNLAADLSTSQSGFGGLATMSERGRFNVEVMGLDKFSTSLNERMVAKSESFQRFKTITTATDLINSEKVTGVSIDRLRGDGVLDAIFTGDLNARRQYLERTFGSEFRDNTLIVNLGEKVGGVEKVAIYAGPEMTSYAGEMAGRGAAPIDLATKDLIDSVQRGQDPAYQLARVKKYKEEATSLSESVTEGIFRSKVLGSTYGQAMPSLMGMDAEAKLLAQRLGHEGSIASLVAVSQEDFFKAHRQMNLEDKQIRDLYRQAQAGEYWGLLTREPAESVQRSIPVNIRIAEEGKAGIIYTAGEDRTKSMLRQGLGVDWDKDPLHLFYSGSKEASSELSSFMNANTNNVMAQEYQRSLKRMALFSLKGKEAKDRGSLLAAEVQLLKDEPLVLEKYAIGPYSNQFKNIHIGLREQVMGSTPTRAAAANFYKGEELSLTLVENILKAKNLSEESLKGGEAFKVLDILKDKTLSQEDRAAQLKEAWDKMFFRENNWRELSELTEKSRDLTPSSLQSFFGEGAVGAEKLQAYREVYSTENFLNITKAHDLGLQIQESGNYAGDIAKTYMRGSSTRIADKFARMADSVLPILKSGATNIAKWGILPTAGIGLAATLLSSPKVLPPVKESASLHEGQQEQSQAKMPQTIYALPPSKTDGMKIRGISNHKSNMNMAMQSLRNQSDNVNIRLTDHRAPSDKYRIEEMVDKGY